MFIKAISFFIFINLVSYSQVLYDAQFFYDHQKISINVFTSSPAYSAFMDNIDLKIVLPEEVKEGALNLSTEDIVSNNNLHEWLEENISIEEPMIAAKSHKINWVPLEGLQIKALQLELTEEKATLIAQNSNIKTKHTIDVNTQSENRYASLEPIKLSSVGVSQKENLPLLSAYETNSYQRTNKEMFKDFESYENSNNDEEITKYIATSSGTPIVIKAPKKNPLFAGGGTTTGFDLRASSRSQNKVVTPDLDPEKSESESPRPDVVVAGLVEKPYYISGHIQMSGGLAYTGQREGIHLFFKSHGEVVEEGQFDFNEAIYNIKVPHLDGVLVAQVRELDSGLLLGEGSIDLSDMKLNNYHQDKIKELDLSISPIEKQVSLLNFGSGDIKLSLWGYPSEDPLKYDKDIFELFSRHSNFIIKAESDGSWPMITRVVPESNNELNTYGEELLDTLLAPVFEEYRPSDKEGLAIIWGKVQKNNKAIAGARLELADSDDNLRIIYFNGLVLDEKLKATSSTGEFLIISQVEGYKSLRASYLESGQQHFSEAQIIPVFKKHVAKVNFYLNKVKYAKLMAYNPLDLEKPLEPSLQVFGSSQTFTSSNNELEFNYLSGLGLQNVEMDLGSKFDLVRFQMNKRENYLRVPVLTQNYYKELAQKLKINIDSSKAIVYGLYQEDFDLIVKSEFQNIYKVIYFNEMGEVVSQGEAHGGFIIFNVAEGYSNFILETEDSKAQNQTQYISAGSINLVRFFQED